MITCIDHCCDCPLTMIVLLPTAELCAARQSQADRAFDQIDTNKDGVITRSEWLTAMRPAGPSSPNTAASVGTDFGIGAGNRMPGSPLPSVSGSARVLRVSDRVAQVPPVVPMGNGGPMYPVFGLGRSPSPPRPEVMDPNHPAHHPPPGEQPVYSTAPPTSRCSSL